MHDCSFCADDMSGALEPCHVADTVDDTERNAVVHVDHLDLGEKGASD